MRQLTESKRERCGYDRFNVLHGLMPEPGETAQAAQRRAVRIQRIIGELKQTGNARLWVGRE